MSVKCWQRQVGILNRAVPRGNAESAPERDSESGLRAHTEFDAKSEARRSESVRARNRVDTELRTDSKSGVGIDAEANADSAAKYNSEAGWGFGVAKVGFGPSAKSGWMRNRQRMWSWSRA